MFTVDETMIQGPHGTKGAVPETRIAVAMERERIGHISAVLASTLSGTALPPLHYCLLIDVTCPSLNNQCQLGRLGYSQGRLVSLFWFGPSISVIDLFAIGKVRIKRTFLFLMRCCCLTAKCGGHVHPPQNDRNFFSFLMEDWRTSDCCHSRQSKACTKSRR
jgi:hypothetical protein